MANFLKCWRTILSARIRVMILFINIKRPQQNENCLADPVEMDQLFIALVSESGVTVEA